MKSTSLAARAVALARQLQQRANELQSSAERRQQAELDRMLQSPRDRATLVQMTDQAFRARLPHRAADQLIHILDVQGVPRFFSPVEAALLKGFQSFGAYLPGVAMPLVKERLQQETANVILPAEEDLLRLHLEARRGEGVRMNVNFLGEALLGERDAERRLQAYLQALARPEIEVISVKISTIFSQVTPLALRQSIETLGDRLELLFRAAARNKFLRNDGSEANKLVYLDMEEYRDKEITAQAFMHALDRPGLERATAGIALQAYVPDSFATQRQITAWARRRVASGGAPVTLRLVKGANLEMERVEASLRGWLLACFSHKRDTDANYARMLRFGMQRENLAAVRVGVASHNLLTLAYGLVLAADASSADASSADGASAEASSADPVQFEMLEGMANHQRRALFELARNVLLYGPACRQEDFTSAIGYLVRRLDDNSGPDNFLRHAFRLQAGDEQWQRLEADFLAAFDRLATLPETPRRTQDRRVRALPPPIDGSVRGAIDTGPIVGDGGGVDGVGVGVGIVRSVAEFQNEPDTDWALAHHADWAASIVDAWRSQCDDRAPRVPLAIGGRIVETGRPQADSFDPSRPGCVVARFLQGVDDDVDAAVDAAQCDADGWRRRSVSERAETLARVARELSNQRGDLLGAMLAETGKLLSEGDAEVSEAIDFCRFYGAAAHDISAMSGVSAKGRGGVVISPWNFPLAIPCGGVAAALAAGNTVIPKPASDAPLVAWRLCECFWRIQIEFRRAWHQSGGAKLRRSPDGTALRVDRSDRRVRRDRSHRSVRSDRP